MQGSEMIRAWKKDEMKEHEQLMEELQKRADQSQKE